MTRHLLVPLGVAALLLLVIVPWIAHAAGGAGGFDGVVSSIEDQYHVHATRIPCMGFASFVAGTATRGGVGGVHVAEFEHFDKPADGEELNRMVEDKLGSGWARMIRETSRHGHEQTLIFAHSEGKHMALFILDLDGKDAGKRLDQRGPLDGHEFRNRNHVTLRHGRGRNLHVLGESAREVIAQRRERVAEVVLLPPAVDALAAADHGGHHSLLPKAQPAVHARADLLDRPYNLVPGNRGRHHVLLPVREDALVRPAHGAARHAQHHLARTRRRLRDFLHPHISRSIKNGCLHLQ